MRCMVSRGTATEMIRMMMRRPVIMPRVLVLDDAVSVLGRRRAREPMHERCRCLQGHEHQQQQAYIASEVHHHRTAV